MFCSKLGAAVTASVPAKDRWFQPISRREAAWLVVGSLAFALVFSYPMLCDRGQPGPGVSGWITTGPRFSHLTRIPANSDWDMFTDLRWVAYQTTTHFLQFPFWNPYKCAGMGMLSNPESMVVSPSLIPYLLFGPYAGLYIEIVGHIAIGFAGGYVLGRVMGLGALAAIVSAVVFPSSSWLYLHLSLGHLNFLPAVYFPWIAALLLISTMVSPYSWPFDQLLLLPAIIHVCSARRSAKAMPTGAMRIAAPFVSPVAPASSGGVPARTAAKAST